MVNIRERRSAPAAAEKQARGIFRESEAKEALSDYAKAQKAFHENRERLKAERLAREAKSREQTGKAR